ncbi:hypothetical protein YSY22_37240 [Brevibacillus formosus]
MKIPYQYMLVFLIVTFVWIGLCWSAVTHSEQLIPPILVVVYESLHKPMFNKKMVFKLGLVLTHFGDSRYYTLFHFFLLSFRTKWWSCCP